MPGQLIISRLVDEVNGEMSKFGGSLRRGRL